LRVLYVLPRAWTDAIVPLQLSPAPSALARVFVGRVEIFTAKEEAAMLGLVRNAVETGTPSWEFPGDRLGRFAEPKLWRLKSLANDARDRQYISSLLSQIPNQ